MGLLNDVYSASEVSAVYDTVTEEQIHSSEEIRLKLIKSFDADRNRHRKREAFKAYECLKDKTVNYVLELLIKQFDHSTVLEMHYAISNISILRKVIDKLAKVYGNGVKRTMPAPEGETPAKPAPVGKVVANVIDPRTQSIEDLTDFLDLNAVMKKANRFFRTFKNTLVYVRPLPMDDKFTITAEVRAPFSYDVVPKPENPKEPLAVVLSDYLCERETMYSLGDAAAAGRTIGIVRDVKPPELVGLTQDDGNDTREFIWWTKSYHFTTNAKGVIKPQDNDAETHDLAGDANPIGELPFVNFCGEQDHGFWAEGGEDLVDAGIKINTMITNVRHIAVSQGYGQMYMTGKNLPKSVKVGPNHCIQLQHEEGEPTPTVGFMEANPPINELKGLIEMDVALMLSTNNLSTSNFSSQLSGTTGKDMSSGVALLIDRSESVEDIEEQAKVFIKKEPEVWVKIAKWHEVYLARQLLVEDLAAIEVPDGIEEVQLQFPSAKPIISETEQLAIFTARKTLGMDTMLALIMRDDPSLSEGEAQEKLDKINAEKQANAQAFMAQGLGPDGKPMPMSPGGMNGNQGQASGGKPGQNGNQPGNNEGP